MSIGLDGLVGRHPSFASCRGEKWRVVCDQGAVVGESVGDDHRVELADKLAGDGAAEITEIQIRLTGVKRNLVFVVGLLPLMTKLATSVSSIHGPLIIGQEIVMHREPVPWSLGHEVRVRFARGDGLQKTRSRHDAVPNLVRDAPGLSGTSLRSRTTFSSPSLVTAAVWAATIGTSFGDAV